MQDAKDEDRNLRGKGYSPAPIYIDEFLDDYGGGETECESMLSACMYRSTALVNRMPAIEVKLPTSATFILEDEDRNLRGQGDCRTEYESMLSAYMYTPYPPLVNRMPTSTTPILEDEDEEEEEEDALSYPALRSDEPDYVAFTEKNTEIGDIEVNELSLFDMEALSLEFKDNKIILYSKEKIPFRLGRLDKRLVVNMEKPAFRRRCDIDDEFILTHQPITHPDDMFEKIRAHLAPLVAEEKKAFDARYDVSNMVARKTWIIQGNALNIKFFNLNTKGRSILTVYSNRTPLHLCGTDAEDLTDLGNNGLALRPRSHVDVMKGFLDDESKVIYSVSTNMARLRTYDQRKLKY